MLYLCLCFGVLLVGLGFAMCLVKSYAKNGLPVNIIPVWLFVIPVLSLAFGVNFFVNPEISFDYVSFGIWVVFPLVYSYVLHISAKHSENVWRKLSIDTIFVMILLLSLPKDTFIFKGLIPGLNLPQYVDNLLFLPVALYLLSTFNAKNSYDGFVPMFTSVMGLGVAGLCFPYKNVVGQGMISIGLIIGFSAGVLFAFNQYPAKVPMAASATSPLILVFLWYVIQFSIKGIPLVLPTVFSYIFMEDIFAMVKKLLKKIKYIDRMGMDARQQYLQVLERGFRPDVALTYIMKWHVGLILVAYVVSDPKISYIQGLGMSLLSAVCIMYMLSRKGIKEPSIKEITNDVFSEFKNAYNSVKTQVGKKTDKEDDNKK